MIIYKITNRVNSKIYIGVTTRSLEKRWRDHCKDAKYNKPHHLSRAIRKHGEENFIIEQIDTASDIKELINKEAEYIKQFKSWDRNIGYNLLLQDDAGKFFTDEVKDKISKSHKKMWENFSPDELENRRRIYRQSSINRQGEKRGASSRFVGVSKTKNGLCYSCGVTYHYQSYKRNFATDIEAAQAYDRLALYLWGEGVKLNFPEKLNDYLSDDLELYFKFFTQGKKGRHRNKPLLFDELEDYPKRVALKLLQEKFGILEEVANSILNLRFLETGALTVNYKYQKKA